MINKDFLSRGAVNDKWGRNDKLINGIMGTKWYNGDVGSNAT